MLSAFFCIAISLHAQTNDLNSFINNCNLEGSITLYDYNNKLLIYSDEEDAKRETLPASTFKIINSLIGLEEVVVWDQYEIIKWDSVVRDIESWNADTDMENAYKNSTVWFYQEITKKVGQKKYKKYLSACKYGNKNTGSQIDRFWLDGSLKISPKNQIEFLVKLYEGNLPFSKTNLAIVKEIMINEKTDSYILRAKTGWGKVEAKDIGWWVGYVETNNNVYFFATRVWKYIETTNDDFIKCRKTITYDVLKKLKIID